MFLTSEPEKCKQVNVQNSLANQPSLLDNKPQAIKRPYCKQVEYEDVLCRYPGLTSEQSTLHRHPQNNQ